MTVPITVALGVVLAIGTASVAQECADSTLTLASSQPGGMGCRMFDDQPAQCAQSYIIGGSGPTSCYIDAEGNCEGCGPRNEGLECINACQPAGVCSGDPGRTLFLGGPDNAACRELTGEPTECNRAYHRSGDGGFASCFTSHRCVSCGDSEVGFCINACVPPPTCADMTRTNFVGGPSTGACQQFAGDEIACNQAYHLGEDGVAPCYYEADEGACRGCGLRNESNGNCVNTCVAPPPCVDGTRTTYAGGPGTQPCPQYDGDQIGCEAAYIRGGNGRATSCFYDVGADACRGCGPENEGDGDCVNTCTVPAPCLDMARTIYTGPPGSEGCTRFDGDQSSCDQAYVEGAHGVASCYYDSGDNRCRGCGSFNEDGGACTNTCVAAPACALDVTRTVYAGGPDSGGCRDFDDDPTQCLQAFVRGAGGFASCFVAPNGNCRGCGPDNVNDGDCINTCTMQPLCGSEPARTALGCGRFDGDPNGCDAAYGLLGDGSPTSCVSLELCLGCGPNNQAEGLCTNTCAAALPAPAPTLSWPGLTAGLLSLAALSLYRLRRRA